MHGTYSAGDKAKMSVRVSELLWQETAALVAERDLFIGDSPNDAPAFAFFERSSESPTCGRTRQPCAPRVRFPGRSPAPAVARVSPNSPPP